MPVAPWIASLLLGFAVQPKLRTISPNLARAGRTLLEHGEPLDDETRKEIGEALSKIFSSGNMPPGATIMINEEDLEEVGGGSEGEDPSEKAAKAAMSIENFDLKPLDIYEYLNRFVIKQDEAKRVLAVACCDHYNHIRRCLSDPTGYAIRSEVSKPNILLVGPTGVGKTYLMKSIAKLIGVPFATADATKFSETGVVGKDAEDVVRDLVKKAGGNTTIAQYGIIYIDEIDKICAPGAVGGQAYGPRSGGFNTRGVQNTFLKLLEDTEVPLQGPAQGMIVGGFPGMGNPNEEEEPRISTKNMLFVFSGAFTSLDAELKRKRSKKGSIGFDLGAADESAGEGGTSLEQGGASGSSDGYGEDEEDAGEGEGASALRHATTADFVEAGLEPEFVGRVPVRVACNALREDDLLSILTGSEGSVLRQMERDFEGYGLTLDHTEDALRQVARLAAAEKTGARGLVTVLERTLRGFKFALPSSSFSSLTMDNATVCAPARTLQALLDAETAADKLAVRLADVKRFEARMKRQLKELCDESNDRAVLCWFTDEAIDVLCSESGKQGISAFSLACQRFENLPPALATIAEQTGQTQFPISAAMARNPDEELESWMAMMEQ